jgi:hypothetical protein
MVMSLKEALWIVGTEANVFGSADHNLLAALNAAGGVPQGKRLALPAGLQGYFPVRPVEVLHALSYVTSPLYGNDIHDMYMQWALLRYLGFFERGVRGNKKIPPLGVSEAGCRVAGAQRRVTSEELGVGFAVVLARRWFRHALGPGIPIGFIDVDAYVSGSGFGGSIRSDYLLIAPDSVKADCYRVRLLECKGTWEEPLARIQMKKAVRQLGSPVISPLPDGIAVSSVTWGSQIRCFAVETRGKGEMCHQPDWEARDVRWGAGDPSSSAGSSGFVATALRGTWGRLADFGGNVEARSIWSGTRDVAQVGIRERNEFQTPYGSAIGVSETVTIGGIRISVTRAIHASVDSALGSGDPASVTAAQSRFAERTERFDGAQFGTASQLFSAAPDGSIFSLAP